MRYYMYQNTGNTNNISTSSINIPKYNILHNGIELQMFALGTSETYPQGLIEYAIKNGFRFIDTAFMYKSEECVGRAIKNCIEEGIVKREDLFIQSKAPHIRAGYNCTLEAFEESISKLGVEYLDSYLIHLPMRDRDNWRELAIDTWRAMEKLYKEGKIKSIGVSNFLIHHLEYLMSKAEIKPMINQIELHPFRHQIELVEYCRKREIVLQAWYPVGKGRVFYSEPLKQLSKKYNTSIMKFVIQWHKQKGFIPILGLYSETEIQEALGKIDFEISPEDMAFVDLLDGTQSSGMHTDGRYLDYIPVIPKFPRLQKATLFEPSVRTYKLFGFIPFFKIKDVNINCKQYYLFNILICRCQQKMIIPNKTNWTREEKLSGKYVIEPIFNIQNEFLECPVFDEKNNVLYCVASKNNKIYKIDLTTKEYETIPTLGGIVGSIALNKDGTLLCAEESGIYKLDLKNNERIFLADFKNKDRVYNDGKLDAKGRFIVGTSGKFNNGKLYSFDGKQVKVLEENITCSNGIAFSKDNKTMYYIDSESHKVAKYKYNLETGEAIFDKYVIEIEAGTPDGMCIDEDENLWIAEYDGCKISKYETKNYTKIDEIIMPVYPTSVCLAKGSNPHPERTSDRGGGLLYCTTTKAKNSNKYSGLFVIRYK